MIQQLHHENNALGRNEFKQKRRRALVNSSDGLESLLRAAETTRWFSALRSPATRRSPSGGKSGFETYLAEDACFTFTCRTCWPPRSAEEDRAMELANPGGECYLPK